MLGPCSQSSGKALTEALDAVPVFTELGAEGLLGAMDEDPEIGF